jgi:NAD(P)H-nitrite reductase large subunit
MRVLILGAGPAGLAAAERLRELERDAGQGALDIEMVSDELHPPYSPPAMADHFLTGRDTTLFWRGRDVLERLRVVHRRGSPVQAVRPDAGQVELANGQRLDYDRLILATGSRLHAPLPGLGLSGLYNFKSLTAAQALVGRARRGEVASALIVGAGFIGVEVALVLRDLGLKVTMVSRRWVMPRALDPEVGAIVLEALRARGVEVLMDRAADGFEGETRVEALRLASGEALRADVYVAATGVKPNCEYLEGSGIELDWGVRVDDRLRTNVPDIYAAGDLAETRDRLTGERYVHAYFPNAVDQGRVAAEHLLGFDTRYPGAESINSLRHLGVPLVAAGSPRGEELRLRDGPVLRKVYVAEGRIAGFRLAGDIRGAGVLRALMLKGADVTAYGRRLLDPAFGAGTVALTAMGLG